MKRLLLLFCLYAVLLYPQAPAKPLVMAHFMPWYQAPPLHGYWGWHWTMNHYNPNIIDLNGYRQIASHYYPVTGPYDSNDTLILEYQTLLMKISGIDGVLVDWYGMADFLDYGLNNISTRAVFKATQKAKLNFGIVMEDNIFKTMISNGYMTADTALAYGKRVMKYLQDNYFTSGTYLKLSGRPVLLNFGPQYFKQSAQWDTLFSVLPVKPMFFTEDTRLAPVATGAFPWTPMSRSDSNGILQQSALISYLNQYYLQAGNWTNVVTTAFPGFRDIYQHAGVHNSYGYLDSKNGATFRLTLNQAVQHFPDVIQIQTWNDYGEGTAVEPTVQFGTQYLEIIRALKDSLIASFPFGPDDLQMPLRIYKARAAFPSHPQKNAVLDRVYNFIIAGQPAPAKTLLDSLLGASGTSPENSIPRKFILDQNYPNPFNPSTSIRFSLPERAAVKLSVYNSFGEEVAVLVSGEKAEGTHEVQWNAAGFVSGIYFYELRTEKFSAVRKLILLK